MPVVRAIDRLRAGLQSLHRSTCLPASPCSRWPPAPGPRRRCTSPPSSASPTSWRAARHLPAVVAGADAVLAAAIIHDWDDESSLTILRNIGTAIAPDGKLLLLEMVLPERTTSFIGYQLDLEMLVTVGGRERTRTDYAKLLSGTGFRLGRVVDTVTPLSIVEASPV